MACHHRLQTEIAYGENLKTWLATQDKNKGRSIKTCSSDFGLVIILKHTSSAALRQKLRPSGE